MLQDAATVRMQIRLRCFGAQDHKKNSPVPPVGGQRVLASARQPAQHAQQSGDERGVANLRPAQGNHHGLTT